MEEKRGILQEKGRFILVFVMVQLLFIILCAISLPKLFSKDKINENDYNERPSLKVTGLLGTMPDASETDAGTLEQVLLDMVGDNNAAVSLKAGEAVIRDGSVKAQYFTKQNVHYYSAVVDIPDLEQSYWVFHEYSSDNYNQYLNKDDRYIVMCLADQALVIYPEFECKDKYEQLTYNAIVQKYIEWFDFDGALVSVRDDFKTVEIEVIRGAADYTDDDYLVQVKGAIQALGISPSLFKYEIVDSEYSPHKHEM